MSRKLHNPMILLVIVMTLAPFAAAGAEAGTYRLYVDGLACPFCAYGVEKQIEQIDGVETLSTDIEKGRIAIEMGDHKTLAREDVEQAVRAAGFTFKRLEPAPAEPAR